MFVYESPFGPLHIAADSEAITYIGFDSPRPNVAHDPESIALNPCIQQLDEYFAEKRQTFDLPIKTDGNPLQHAVWEQLQTIPFGTTVSYGAVAKAIDPDLYPAEVEPYLRPRIVGAAVGANPVAIVVPCHRVIGANGSLTGYRGGLEHKRQLLELEKVLKPAEPPASQPDQLALL